MSKHDSPVDVEAAAERLNVAEGALHGVVDNFERRADLSDYKVGERPLIADVLEYNHAIALVELTEPIGHNTDPAPYALVNFEGHVFPFHPADVEYLSQHVESAEIGEAPA